MFSLTHNTHFTKVNPKTFNKDKEEQKRKLKKRKTQKEEKKGKGMLGDARICR